MSPARTHSTDRSSLRETIAEAGAGIGAPAFYGPPISFLFVPWLLLVLLLIPPFAVVFTIGLVLAVGAALLAAVGALVASPYLLVRHVRAHRSTHEKRQPSPQPSRSRQVSPVRLGSPQVKGAS
jgi:hypothetical protein